MVLREMFLLRASMRPLLLVASCLVAACAGTPGAIAPSAGGAPGLVNTQVASSVGAPSSIAERAHSVHTILGVPRGTRGLHAKDMILDRGEFVVGYDEDVHLARWVAWRVRKADLGKVKRKNQFHADPDLPAGLLKVETADYAHTGYDRGHLCPSGDRTASEEANHRTFLMTNMHAQKHALNAGPWEELEGETRDLLRRPDDVVYVVAGPLLDEKAPRIGRGVAVPYASFKVLIALKDGQGAADVRETVYHAAAIMPNDDTTEGKHWRAYATSIRAVEQTSGYDFFSAVPSSIQDAIEVAHTP